MEMSSASRFVGDLFTCSIYCIILGIIAGNAFGGSFGGWSFQYKNFGSFWIFKEIAGHTIYEKSAFFFWFFGSTCSATGPKCFHIYELWIIPYIFSEKKYPFCVLKVWIATNWRKTAKNEEFLTYSLHATCNKPKVASFSLKQLIDFWLIFIEVS